ncbi:hypothetical protein QYF61_025937 [Mycteria americana]|uniref:Uncharacterized protein n=1 Tax=Mycteria americana TaxID=33587 RepID=A0AAN7MZP4_MYCAM|nr:hypothetical protein QYF61_025937 [Mycteria americana]
METEQENGNMHNKALSCSDMGHRRTSGEGQRTAILHPLVHHQVVMMQKDGDKLFSRACCKRTRGKGFKLKEGIFRLDIRKTFFMMRVVKHWNRLPREVVDAPSLETIKVRLDGALSNLITLKDLVTKQQALRLLQPTLRQALRLFRFPLRQALRLQLHRTTLLQALRFKQGMNPCQYQSPLYIKRNPGSESQLV